MQHFVLGVVVKERRDTLEKDCHQHTKQGFCREHLSHVKADRGFPALPDSCQQPGRGSDRVPHGAAADLVDGCSAFAGRLCITEKTGTGICHAKGTAGL